MKFNITAAFVFYLIPALSNAQEFKAGNLIVLDRAGNRIYEFDSSLQTVRVVNVGAQLDAPLAGSFGPNGHLFVSSDLADKVVEFDSTFITKSEIGVGDLDAATGVEFGPNGDLYVNSFLGDKIVIFNAAGAKQSDFGAGTGLNGGDDIQFLPDGHVWVGNNVASQITELDSSGKLIRNITVTSSSSIAIAPTGILFVTQKNPPLINLFDSSGAGAGSFGGADLIFNGLNFGLTFGPDERLYVADLSFIKVFNAQKLLVDSFRDDDTPFSNCSDVIVVPYRFQAGLQGTFLRNDGTIIKIKENVNINYAPGTPKCSIQFIDGTSALDMASLLNTGAWVFHGIEIPEGSGDKVRNFSGTQVGSPALTAGTSTMSLNIAGKRDSHQFFTINKMNGDLRFISSAGQFVGKVTTKKLLK